MIRYTAIIFLTSACAVKHCGLKVDRTKQPAVQEEVCTYGDPRAPDSTVVTPTHPENRR